MQNNLQSLQLCYKGQYFIVELCGIKYVVNFASFFIFPPQVLVILVRVAMVGHAQILQMAAPLHAPVLLGGLEKPAISVFTHFFRNCNEF